MELDDVLKPCIKKSFFGSVLSAGTALITGHFALIPVTAKFITNFSFCVKDQYTERLWNEAKEKLYTYAIPNTNIRRFRDELLFINYGNMSANRNDVLKGLLNSSLNILKYSIDGWASDKFQEIVNYCLNRTSEISISSEDYYILNEKIKSNQQELINQILGQSFVKATYNYVPQVSRVIDYSLLAESIIPKFRETENTRERRFQRNEQPMQVIEQISMLPNGRMAAQVIKLLFRNVGRTTTYERLAKISDISYEYSNSLLNRLDGYVVEIDKRRPLHVIYIYPNFDEITFYKKAFDGLKRN